MFFVSDVTNHTHKGLEGKGFLSDFPKIDFKDFFRRPSLISLGPRLNFALKFSRARNLKLSLSTDTLYGMHMCEYECVCL